MTPSESASVFFALSSLLLCWCCWIVFYRSYRAARVRNLLRLLADDLFDHALTGRLPLLCPAYRQLHEWLQLAIDRAGEVTFTRWLMALAYPVPAAWEMTIAGLSPVGRSAASAMLQQIYEGLLYHACPGFALAPKIFRRPGLDRRAGTLLALMAETNLPSV